MANSNTFVKRNLTTGAGETGLTVTLKRANDNFTAVYKTAVEVPGKPGVYRFTDLETNRYRLFINGTEDDTFSDVNGRWITSGESMIIVNGDGHFDSLSKKIVNVADGSGPKDAVNNDRLAQVLVDNNFAKNQASNTFTEINVFEDEIITTDLTVLNEADFTGGAVAVPDDAGGNRAVNNNRMAIYVASQLGKYANQQPNIIEVMPNIENIEGKRYSTILQAVTYANNQTPTVTKQFYIYVYAMPSTSDRLILASGSIKNYVHIIGMSRDIRLIVDENPGADSPISVANKMNFENLTLIFGTKTSGGVSTTSRELLNINLYNVAVYTYRQLTINNGSIENCTRLIASGTNDIHISGSTDLLNCVFKRDPVMDSDTGARIFSTSDSLIVLDDPTSGA